MIYIQNSTSHSAQFGTRVRLGGVRGMGSRLAASGVKCCPTYNGLNGVIPAERVKVLINNRLIWDVSLPTATTLHSSTQGHSP